MTTTQDTTTVGHDIVLSARVDAHQVTFTPAQLRDTVASYLARGGHMPTPTESNGRDPFEPFHIIIEESLYGNVQAWIDGTDIRQLAVYRHQAVIWLRFWFRGRIPELEALN